MSDELPADESPSEEHGELVFLVGAANNNEAAILRGYLEHQGIYVYVQGEQHRAMLGMVGAYIELRLMVPAESLDDAKQALELFYSEQENQDGPEFRGAFRDEVVVADEDKYDDEIVDQVRLRQALRRARLAGLAFPIGGAHFAAGAWVRGLVLAALSITSVVLTIAVSPTWILLYVLSVSYDLMSVRGPLFANEVRRARAETAQLPDKND